jgi:hypothetical protein
MQELWKKMLQQPLMLHLFWIGLGRLMGPLHIGKKIMLYLLFFHFSIFPLIQKAFFFLEIRLSD